MRLKHLAAALLSGPLMACSALPPDTPLFDGIHRVSSHDARQALLAERIARRYPLGTREAGLEAYLERQDFKVIRGADALAPGQPIYGEARARYGPGPCQMIATVYWRGDPRGRLTELHVNHLADVCILPSL